MRNNNNILTKELLEHLFITEGKTIQEIADILNVKYSAVHTYLSKYQIKKGNIRKKISKETLFDLFVNKRLGKWTIAKMLNVSYSCVAKNLKLYGIIDHDSSESIETMKKLYIEGKSLNDISNILHVPKSSIRKLLLNNNVLLRNKYNCHCNTNNDSKFDFDISVLKSQSKLRRKLQEYFKNNIAIPIKKDVGRCEICGSTTRLHAHHIKPLQYILNEIISENKNKTDEELLEIIKHDNRYLDRNNIKVVCEKCHYTIFHPYVNYQGNPQPSVLNDEGSTTIPEGSTSQANGDGNV